MAVCFAINSQQSFDPDSALKSIGEIAPLIREILEKPEAFPEAIDTATAFVAAVSADDKLVDKVAAIVEKIEDAACSCNLLGGWHTTRAYSAVGKKRMRCQTRYCCSIFWIPEPSNQEESPADVFGGGTQQANSSRSWFRAAVALTGPRPPIFFCFRSSFCLLR